MLQFKARGASAAGSGFDPPDGRAFPILDFGSPQVDSGHLSYTHVITAL